MTAEYDYQPAIEHIKKAIDALPLDEEGLTFALYKIIEDIEERQSK